MSKMWNVNRTAIGNAHHIRVEDLGSFPTRSKAVAFAQKYLKEEDWILFHEGEDVVVYRFGNGMACHSELVIESIHVAP